MKKATTAKHVEDACKSSIIIASLSITALENRITAVSLDYLSQSSFIPALIWELDYGSSSNLLTAIDG